MNYRKQFISAVIIGSLVGGGLALEGCNPASIQAVITQYEQDVAAAVSSLCGVDPILSSLAGLFGLESVAAAAAKICAAVPSSSTKLVGGALQRSVVVDGVTINFK